MYVSALLVRGLVERARTDAWTVEELLYGTGITYETLYDQSARLPTDAAYRCILRLMELTGDPALGLTLSAAPPAGAHSVLYHMLVASRSLREAAQTFQRLAGQVVQHAKFALLEEGEVGRFVYSSTLHLGDSSRFAADFTLAFAHRVATTFYRSSSDRPIRVMFRHPRPSYAARYNVLFGCPVLFDCAHSEIVFPREFLDWEHLLSNDVLKQAIEGSAARLLSANTDGETIAERIRILLRCTRNFELASTERIAKHLAVSERSLRRRLQTEGVSLMAVVDGVRREIACEELAQPKACIKSTAETLGFADRAAFHRAFKRWTGETPSSYRTRRVG